MLVRLPASRRRSFLVAVKHSGVKLAQGFAGVLLAPLATFVGWRWAAAVPAVVALLGGAWAPGFLRSRSTPVGTSFTRRRRVPPKLWWVTASTVAMGLSQSAVGAYIALYAFEVVGTSPAVAGVVAGVLGLSGFLGRLVWGGW
ncbi:MAG: hypothetical protein GEV28_40925 [Actinophytocola sp.]|uniref:MFS transporter n=1 Tax=Actinophytocola sp. TaxID=1872138 RepID=UPI00132CB9A4|nr:MFS transporter [Actinophytocola sp.]MPZ86400.1 hypothetical protein [Actinophytocola sp.]